MAFLSSIHNHCNYCDGHNAPEEMIEAAIAAGIEDFGFSCHGHDSLCEGYSIDDEEVYAASVRSLAAEYAGRIKLYCGIEQEAIEPVKNRALFDYIIGSVHYVRTPDNGPFVPVDDDICDIMRAIKGPFHGDAMNIVRAYYELMVWQAHEYRPDVIGHFDVVCKHNGNNALFDEESREYRSLALEALDAVIETGAVFELNTAGFKKSCARQYPSRIILERLLEKGAPVVLTTDCHDASLIDSDVERSLELLREIGFTQLVTWRDGSFQECTC